MTTTNQGARDLLAHELPEIMRSATLDEGRGPMKILLVGNYGPDNQASMRAFLRALARELPHRGCELRVINPPQRVQRSTVWRQAPEQARVGPSHLLRRLDPEQLQ